jgi:hypothetical protein
MCEVKEYSEEGVGTQADGEGWSSHLIGAGDDGSRAACESICALVAVGAGRWLGMACVAAGTPGKWCGALPGWMARPAPMGDVASAVYTWSL